MRLDYEEAWNNAHDPQRAAPIAYCPVCGGEIYSEDELYEFDGLCSYCAVRKSEALEESEDGAD